MEYNKKETKKHGDSAFNFDYYVHDDISLSYGFPAHWHEEFEIMYVTTGHFDVWVDSIEFKMHEGDILFMAPFSFHSCICNNIVTGTFTNFVFGEKLLFPDSTSKIYTDLFKKNISTQNTFKPFIFSSPSLILHLENILELVKKMDENMLSVQIELLSIFDELFKNKVFIENQESEKVNSSLLKNVILFIQYNYKNNISIDEIARSVYISPDHLIRLLKKAIGFSPKEYIIRLRLQDAIHLMAKNQTESIANIAIQSGFDDVNYFSRLFKKKMGITPSEYRKKI